MPAPYSSDLRERVVAAYEKGEGTYVEIALRFGVGEATVDRWVSRKRRTGSVEPSPMGGDRNGKFDDAADACLLSAIDEAPDATRAELVSMLRGDRGLVVSPAAVQRAMERLNVTRKKRPSTRRNATHPV
jgi:transposase